MCVWSGQGGRNCREDLLAGGQPPIRPNGGEKPEFPAAGHETALRSPFDRWLCGCSSSLYTHTRHRRRYSSCNLPRWNAIETIPVILAFQRAFNRACRVLYQNGNRANGLEREKEKFAREAGREGGPRLRTRRTPSRKLFAVLSANRVNLHKSRGDNNRA